MQSPVKMEQVCVTQITEVPVSKQISTKIAKQNEELKRANSLATIYKKQTAFERELMAISERSSSKEQTVLNGNPNANMNAGMDASKKAKKEKKDKDMQHCSTVQNQKSHLHLQVSQNALPLSKVKSTDVVEEIGEIKKQN